MLSSAYLFWNTTDLPVPTTNTKLISWPITLQQSVLLITPNNFTANQHRTCPLYIKLSVKHSQKTLGLPELKFAIKSTRSISLGADNICYEMFKHMSDTSLQVLLSHYNSIWNSGAILQSWSHSFVVPIPNPKKLSYLPSSYRSILLTSNACKLMEKMIVRRLKWYLEYNKFLDINSQDSENGDELQTTFYAFMMPCKNL